MLNYTYRREKNNLPYPTPQDCEVPCGMMAVSTGHGIALVPNEARLIIGISEDIKYEIPAYLRCRSVIIDTYTGEEVRIDLSHGDMLGRYIRKEVF